jgi:hypothetical protein
MTNQIAEEIEQARDLRSQLSGLGSGDEQQIQFEVSSPGRRRVHLWSMVDGVEIVIPKYMAASALSKRDPRSANGYLFTSRQTMAPPVKLGTLPCFLHPDAPEAAILQDAGVVGFCPANALASNYSRRIHAQNRHRQQWEMYQDYINTQERQADRARQDKQMEAMMSLAEGAAGRPGRQKAGSE